jgi:hypothetical protein
MRMTTRRSLWRVWRIVTWPLSNHIAFALATGLACGIVAARYPGEIAPPYAAIAGTLGIYPALVAMWHRLHPPEGDGR